MEESRNANEIGRKTFLWYRVYCVALAVLYLVVAGAGIFLMYLSLESEPYERDEIQFIGLLNLTLGTVSFVAFTIASFLPAKPYNWIVGITMLAIGMTSCCFWPAVIPLLIFWVKPETQAFFGRKQTP